MISFFRQISRLVHFRQLSRTMFWKYIKSDRNSWQGRWYFRYSNRLYRLERGSSPWRSLN